MTNFANIPKRLRAADRAIARYKRRTGQLLARLYFKPVNGGYSEVETYNHQSPSFTPEVWKTGIEVDTFQHAFWVSKDWYEDTIKAGQQGTYALTVQDGQPLLPCELISQSAADDSTYAVLQVKVIQPTTTYN